jgi:translation initiation factor IF-2
VKSDDRQSGRSLDDRSGEKPSLGVSPSPTKPSLPKPSVLRKQDTLAEQAVQLDAPPAALKPKSVPEIQRPKRIIPAGQRDSQSDKSGIGELEKGASGIVTTPVVDLPETEDFKLRRPSVPRLKKDKERDDEDDELQEVRSVKAGKVATKGKRRGSTLLDEDLDEEFIDDDLSIPAPTVLVSLSLARPAKPKSAKASQPKPMMAPKAKKQVGRDSDEETRNRSRRDRREEPAEVERPKKITLTGRMTVQDLAHLLMVPETEVIKTLFLKGIAANINQALELDTIQMVAEALEVEVETVKEESAARKVTEMLDLEDLEHLLRRPPVVTIMGHVDHGKTTLLDSIRKTKVAQGEAGGITQHIGAYHVDVQHEDKIQQVVFLDTPGHEAFTAMRARGARVTDIAVLVVAADDGVQPQTIEAISHAKAAGVPIVVAINKVDKEGANPDRVKQELSEHGLVPEEWGGDTIMVPVSAIKGENLDSLLEMILLVAELEDLSANPDRLAKGTVIEANLDRARGPVATLLVQNGTLRIGDILVAGSASGKVRAMVDDLGRRVEEAGPSFAVEVLGLGSVPAAGDEFQVYQDEKDARAVVSSMEDKQRQERLQKQAMAARRISLNTMSARAQEGDLKELNLILKADVQGSVEAILNALQQLPQNEVQLRVLLAAPGEVTQTDIDLAAASSAVILAFNTTLAIGVRQIADDLGVDVRDYNIIYKLLDDVQGAMEGLLEPELVEEPLGQAEVRAVFQVGRGLVAGCYVQSGKVTRNCNIRVYRNKGIIYEGVLDSLKRMKEDAKEVATGYECGIGSNSFNAWEIGDIIEAFRMVTKRRTLSTN